MLQRFITPNFFLILLLVVSIFASGIAEANNPPEIAQTIDNRRVVVWEFGEPAPITNIIGIFVYFKDPDGDTLTYTATSDDTSIATVSSVSYSVLTLKLLAEGTATITVKATDPGGLSVEQSFSVTTALANRSPVPIPIPEQRVTVNATTIGDLDLSFSDPEGGTLTYTATSNDTAAATVSVSGSIFTITGVARGSAIITVTATDPEGLSTEQSFVVFVEPQPDIAGSVSDVGDPASDLSDQGSDIAGTVVAGADAVPGLSSQEVSVLGALLRYDTVVFNELHNGAIDTNDWLELRNVSGTDIPLDDWELTVRTGSGSVVIPFPTGTVIPAGEVLLLRNTEMAPTDPSVSSLVAETFVLPQSDFALILRSPSAFGDLAGNYFQAEGERPETAPAFTVDTVWYRTEPFVFGYRAEAWTESSDGLGTPGYHRPSLTADLNDDGVVNILDLVLVASQFGSTGTTADLNADGIVNIDDLTFVANAFGDVAGAPGAERSTAGLVNSWLRLARQHTSSVVETSLPEGFSYERGMLTLEQLARGLMPERTALLANYPNPFNPETWIPYQLAKAADVTVTIYTSEGSVVRTLVLGHQDAGMYKSRSQAAYWDGKNELGESVASGLYFYTLTAGEFTATRRMLILK